MRAWLVQRLKAELAPLTGLLLVLLAPLFPLAVGHHSCDLAVRVNEQRGVPLCGDTTIWLTTTWDQSWVFMVLFIWGPVLLVASALLWENRNNRIVAFAVSLFPIWIFTQVLRGRLADSAQQADSLTPREGLGIYAVGLLLYCGSLGVGWLKRKRMRVTE